MNKFYDAIMGLTVGDALGVPFEFKPRDTFTCTDMIGHGTYDQPVGTWSDDTSMTLATIESLNFKKKIDLEDIMWNFSRWLFQGVFTQTGEVFDVGATCHRAICKYYFEKRRPEECGGDRFEDNGNGSLMRILPLAFIKHSIKDVHNVSALTHAHDISKTACEIYLDIASGLLAGREKSVAVKGACYKTLPEEFSRIRHLEMLDRSEIRSSGYVIDTLEAALWCLLTTDSYRKCVLKAVNLGEDTDTVAAVAGGLAGIYYGIGGTSGIPEEWIAKINRKELIEELCENENIK